MSHDCSIESQPLEAATSLNAVQSSVTERSKADGLSPTRLPGLVALISRRGAEHVAAIGTLAFDRKAPVRRDTIFRLASVTKPITAVAAMILIEECKLRLDDPVDECLPELTNREVLRTLDSELDDTVPANRTITVRDLLTHRSEYGEVFFLSPKCPLSRGRSARLACPCAPGCSQDEGRDGLISGQDCQEGS